MWTKIWLWIKGLFTNLYNKKLIDINEFEAIIETIDINQDNGLSANEIWTVVKELLIRS